MITKITKNSTALFSSQVYGTAPFNDAPRLSNSPAVFNSVFKGGSRVHQDILTVTSNFLNRLKLTIKGMLGVRRPDFIPKSATN
jgi:hypothetical protein